MLITNVKFKPDSLYAEYTKKEVTGDETHTSSHNSNWTYIPHPDLQKEVNKLRIIVSKSMGFSDAFTAMRNVVAKSKIPTVDNLEKESLKDINITGITISGKERKSITITATKKCHNKEKIGFKCPQIRLDAQTFGFEHEVDEIVNDVVSEVMLYIEENKRAQLEIPLGEPVLEKA